MQSLNDFLVFGTMAVGSFLSGALLASYGWDMILWISFLPLLLAGAALFRKVETQAPVSEQERTSRA